MLIFLSYEAACVNIVFLDALPVKLIGMNADLMCQYIEFVADHLVVSHMHGSLALVDSVLLVTKIM